MKRHLHNSLRALFLSLAVLMSLPMLAVEVEIDGINYELNADAKQATVIAKSSGEYSGEVVIPESVEYGGDAYSVTSIGEDAFRDCSGLTSVTIGNSVKSIGNQAFYSCSGLTSVHISDIAAWCNIDFKDYASNPLYYAEHLYLNGEEVKDLVIPNSVTSIGNSAFRGCDGLTSVTIPNSVESIGGWAFEGCYGLTSVTIPNSVTSIGERAFDNCSGLTSVTIPNSVLSIGEGAFSSCDGLTSVTIPNSVTRIEAYAFYYCSGLTSVTIPNSVTSIGAYAFFSCSSLTSVTIPNSVTSIGYGVFEDCSGLTSVTIPNSVTSIGDRAFCDCSGLTSVTIPNSVTSIGGLAFDNCSGLTSVHISDIAAWCNIGFGGYHANPLYYAHHLYLNGEEVKDLVIPNSVTSIGSYAFDGCSGLPSVTIPNSVTSIEESTFVGCSGLTSVTIPNSVLSIGLGAFAGCSGLPSVTIPNSVTSIGSFAFVSCSSLTSVTIPNSVTRIEANTFSSCSGLTSVTIPNSVTSIDNAFSNCSKLLDVYCYAENVPSTQSDAFSSSPIADATLHVPNASINSYKATEPWSGFGNIVAISTEVDGINYDFDADKKQATVIKKSSGKYSGEVIIPESVEYGGDAYSVTSIGEDAFYECSGLTSVTIGNSVTSIGDMAFYKCSGLTSVTIPNSVTSIGGFAFLYCESLTSVHISDIAAWCNIDFNNSDSNPLSYAHHLYLNGEEVKDLVIPNSVTSIKRSAFYGCSGLTSVTIPNSVTSIGWRAFSGCSGLTSVTIPNSVTSIGDYAFYECSGLTSVTIGNGVESIGEYAFLNCSGLTSVTIPNSVTSIGGAAFFGCSDLTSVTIGNSVTSIGWSAFEGCSGLTSVTIGNSVTSIGYQAFCYCSGLTSVTIPNSVTSIGNHAFFGCSGLTSVTIGNSVTSIGSSAFRGCSGLTSVTIGNGVESIGEYAFAFCPELLDVYCYAENVPSTESNTFESSPIASATLHVPAASIDSYKSTAPWSSFGKIVGLSNEFNLTVSSAGYATLFLDFNAEIPAGVQAYTGVKVVGNRLKMERVEGVLPANTGVIIKAEEGTYTFAESDATPATIGDNLLYGTVATTQISTDPTYSYYVLSKVDGIVGMYLAKLTDGKFQNNANKAYMMLKKGDLGIYDEGVDTGTEQLSRGFVFDFGDETGIDELKSEDGKVKTAIFDLSGRRVQKAQKGVFIQNGKVMVR